MGSGTEGVEGSRMAPGRRQTAVVGEALHAVSAWSSAKGLQGPNFNEEVVLVC